MKWPGLVGFSLLALCGCSEELGPEPMPTARVVGKVHIRGQPIRYGWVEITPVDGTLGVMHCAPIQSDGSFEAVAAVGRNTLAIAPRRLLPSGFHELEQGGIIHRDIEQVSLNTVDIDLQDELLSWLRRKANPGEKPAEPASGTASDEH